MSLNLNRVMLAGNLTRDPKVRFFANERAVADFAIAINRKYKNKEGEKMEEVTFIEIECWNRTAELVGQYLTKGRGAYIEGTLKIDVWDDKDTGQKRSKLKVVADTVQFLDSAKGDKAPAEDAAPARQPIKPAAAVADDEPPF